MVTIKQATEAFSLVMAAGMALWLGLSVIGFGIVFADSYWPDQLPENSVRWARLAGIVGCLGLFTGILLHVWEKLASLWRRGALALKRSGKRKETVALIRSLPQKELDLLWGLFDTADREGDISIRNKHSQT